MPTLSVEINEEQEKAFQDVLNQIPGWNKALVVRSLLAYFLGLSSIKQEELVKKYRVLQKPKN